MPVNLAMQEGFALANQRLADREVSTLEAAAALGVTAVASASLLQTRVIASMPRGIETAIAGLSTHAQRALQFTRSAPGVTTALVGMSQARHVEENLGVAGAPLLDPAHFQGLFKGK